LNSHKRGLGARGGLALALAALLCLSAFAAQALELQCHAPLRPPEPRGLSLYVMPLLGADCMLVVADGQTLLVDMGKDMDYPVIRDHLRRLGIHTIDLAFNTHPHSDHVGAMPRLAEEFKVGRFLTAFPADVAGPSVFQKRTLTRLEALGVPVERVSDGDRFALGGAQCLVMQNAIGDMNARSALLHISYGETALLLAADVDVFAQNRIYRAYPDALRAQVLKYPHHGTGDLDSGFFKAVSPEFTIITHGSGDSKKSQCLLDRWDIPYMFATRGVITVHSDGEKLFVSQDLMDHFPEQAQ